MPALGLDHITGRIMRAGEGRVLRKLQRTADRVLFLEEEFSPSPTTNSRPSHRS